MKSRLLLPICTLILSAALLAEIATPPPTPEVPYPEGYRRWAHVVSAVMPPKDGEAATNADQTKVAAPHGLLHNLYANDLALEGYRTGRFPEGAVLIADWFIIEKKRTGLMQGPRKSVDVMIRDARYADTGGWGFENFEKDSHTVRNVRQNAAKACFECHTHATKDREFVFSTYQP
jgi:hypothetical protein